jgi:hypothetical protein
MGFNYKTTDPQDTDFIYQAPTNVMMQAIQVADQANDQQIQQADILGNTVANVKYLPTDEAAVKAAQDTYSKQIDDATTQIMQDPANFRKHMPLIRNITRDLTSNLQNGELASYQAKATALAQWDQVNHQKVIGEKGKPGTVTPEAYKAARAAFLSDYDNRVKQAGGRSYNPQTKTSIPLTTEDLYDTPDINKAITDATDKIKANSSDWKRDSATGEWIFTNQSKNESVEQARVAQVAKDTITSDPHITGYLKQGSKLGYLKGAYDKDGNFIEPYSTDAHGKITWNPNSMLTSSIRAAVGKDAYKKSVTEQAMKDNPYVMQSNVFGHQEKMAVLNNQLSDASKEKAEVVAQKNKVDMSVIRTAELNGTSIQSVLDKLAGGTPKTVLTTSPDGTTTISPFAGDGQLTSDKINKALIPQTQSEMADLLAKTKDSSLTDNQRGLFQQQYDQQKALYDQYTQWNTLAHDDAVQKLGSKYSDKDLAGYLNYTNPNNWLKYGLTKTLEDLRTKLQQIENPAYTQALRTKGGPGNISPYLDSQKAKALLQHQSAIIDQVNKYNDIEDRLKKGQDDWFKNNSKETNISLKGAGLSPVNKQLLYDRIKVDPNVQIHDLKTDKSPESDQIQDIIKTVLDKGRNLSDYIDIKTINPPAPGIGVTATFRLKKEHESIGDRIFRHDMFDNNIYNHDMVMTLPSDVLNAVGTQMKHTGSDTEKNIGELITNQSKSDLMSAFSNRIMSKDANGNDQPVSITTVYDPATRQRIRVKLVPISAQGSETPQSYQAFVTNAAGQDVLFTTPSNPKGEFANTKAVVDAMMP